MQEALLLVFLSDWELRRAGSRRQPPGGRMRWRWRAASARRRETGSERQGSNNQQSRSDNAESTEERRTCGREYFNGNPRQRRQDGADGLAGQIGGRGLIALRADGGFGFEFGLGLAHLFAGCLARGVEGRVALGAPLLDALLAKLVGLGAGLAQALGILGGFGFGLRRPPCGRLPWRLP